MGGDIYTTKHFHFYPVIHYQKVFVTRFLKVEYKFIYSILDNQISIVKFILDTQEPSNMQPSKYTPYSVVKNRIKEPNKKRKCYQVLYGCIYHHHPF